MSGMDSMRLRPMSGQRRTGQQAGSFWVEKSNMSQLYSCEL